MILGASPRGYPRPGNNKGGTRSWSAKWSRLAADCLVRGESASILPVVGPRGSAGFVDGNAVQQREGGGQPRPDPVRQHLGGRVLEAVDFVQAVVVELVVDGLLGLFEIGEVDHPTGLFVDLAFDSDENFETMAV